MNLSTAIQGFLLDKTVAGCSPNTIRNYTLTLKRLQDHLAPADPDLRDVTVDHLKTFIHHLQTARFKPGGITDRPPKRLAPKTIRNAYTVLCSLWTWAVREEHTDQHIPSRISVPKPEPPAIQPLTQRQIRALLEATAYSRPWSTSPDTQTELPKQLHLRNRALILLLLDSGIRAGELCRLTVGDVDLTHGTARVTGKGRLSGGEAKPRIVHFGGRTRKALWAYLVTRNAQNDPDAPLFATRSGEPLRRKALGTRIRRIGQRAGVPRVYPHRLRHTFAINYLRNGGDIYTLQRILGHTSLEMVRRYLKLAEADAAAAHRRASPVDNWRL